MHGMLSTNRAFEHWKYEMQHQNAMFDGAPTHAVNEAETESKHVFGAGFSDKSPPGNYSR